MRVLILIALFSVVACTKGTEIKNKTANEHLQIKVEAVDKDGSLTTSETIPLNFKNN